MSQRAVFIAAAISLLAATLPINQAADTASEKLRARAWEALRSNVKDEKVRNHSLAVEAIMRQMAVPKMDNPDDWALAGLLHDIDIDTTSGNLSQHGIVGARMLRDLGFSQAVVHAVSAHDDHAGVARKSRLDHALPCADQVYWLIIGTGLSFPSDALRNAVPDSVWQQVRARRTANFDKITNECAQIGLTMPRALDVALTALRNSK